MRIPIVRGGRSNPAWYLNKGDYLYKDRVSEFVCDCNTKSGGLTIKRLEKIYDHIYVDEMQDLAGWDQEIIELLMQSTIAITLMGDPRQATYVTNRSTKNKAQKGRHITNWIEQLSKDNMCIVEERTECFRCNQEICDFADGLYPDLPQTMSKNLEKTGHDGIFIIKPHQVTDYVSTHKPQIL